MDLIVVTIGWPTTYAHTYEDTSTHTQKVEKIKRRNTGVGRGKKIEKRGKN